MSMKLPNPSPEKKKRSIIVYVAIVLGVLLLLNFVLLPMIQQAQITDVTYDEFLDAVAAEQIDAPVGVLFDSLT